MYLSPIPHIAGSLLLRDDMVCEPKYSVHKYRLAMGPYHPQALSMGLYSPKGGKCGVVSLEVIGVLKDNIKLCRLILQVYKQ